MSAPLLVSAEWLARHSTDRRIRIADVRWSLLESGKGRNAYLQAHIPGAVFIDVDVDLASPHRQGPGRHPLPDPENFAASMSLAGIGSDIHVIAHDFGDGSTAARFWWLLRYFGHDQVSLLDGGIAHWNAEGRPLESRVASYRPRSFFPKPHPGMSVNADVVEQLRKDSLTLVLDARAADRYEGKFEPIDPIAAHIPGAKNNPYATNARSPEDPRFLEPEHLREKFRQLGVDRAARVICYCGSGINACQNIFALQLAGFDAGLLYEGSWSDWCSVPTREVRTGPKP